MFLEPQELDTVVSTYKLAELIEGSETVAQSCCLAAIKRVRSYLNAKYDADIIFNATGDQRDPELLEICKNVALWFLIRKNNLDIIYTRVKENYDRDIAYLKELANGTLSGGFPLRKVDGVAIASPRMGSKDKFTHSF